MAWFSKPKYTVLASKNKDSDQKEVWTKCDSCGGVVYNKDWASNLKVCPNCGFHQKLNVRERVDLLCDENSFIEHDHNIRSKDPLEFVDSKGPYNAKLTATENRTGSIEAIVCGTAKIHDNTVELAVMDFSFLGGSMGTVVGEKICRSIDRSLKNKTPLIIVSCSGGARMHEGILSLMQMAKTSAWLAKMDSEGLPFISLITHPTTGGVTASYASLGDIIIAEPGALIGFAGPRVIEQTIRQKLPDGFQQSEFLLEHGFIDIIVERKNLKSKIAEFLQFFNN